MMAKSTARFISYDLRPSKQSERGIFIDLLKIAGDCGLSIRDYHYIGMGAVRFYDFLMVHKFLGIQKMISLEHDAHMFKRAQFNVPFSFVDVRNVSSTEFLADAGTGENAVVWFDYDGGISTQITGDIASLCTRMQLGDFCFITAFGGVPGAHLNFGDTDRLAKLQDVFDDLAGQVTLDDVQKASFGVAVHKILMAAFKHGFTYRSEGVFQPILQVSYSDSTSMVTVGGAFVDHETATKLREKISFSLPFLIAGDGEWKFYDIRPLNITERERYLFDRAVTSENFACDESKALDGLGFDLMDLECYRDLIRYLPRYVETIV